METLVFISIVFCGLIVWFLRARPGPVRYRKKAMLTGADRELFHRLREALPECHICPQVGLSALIEPTGMGKIRKAAIDMVRGKRVGHAVFDEDMNLLVVVEFVHKKRGSRVDVAVKSALSSAGIRVLRVEPKHLPSAAGIRSRVYQRTATKRHAEFKADDRGQELEFKASPWRDSVVHI